MRNIGFQLLIPAVGILLSGILCAILLVAIGETPSYLWEALQTTLFTGFGLGYTLYYATPLIFTGLAVAICFHCGLFNIGAEGQLYVGALAVVFVSLLFPRVPIPVAWFLGLSAAMLAGGVWAFIAGFFKAVRGSHEVIVTILMNFVAIAFCDYFILYRVNNPATQNPETLPVSAPYQIPLLSDLGLEAFKTTPVNLALVLGVLAAIAVWLFLFKSIRGYEIRAVGLNPTASRFSGISVNKNIVIAFFLSGALAGMVGVNEVMGSQHRVLQGFSPGYGFTGIAVALIARNHPLGILASAVLFGALHNSSRELEFLSEKVSKELSLVLQALLISCVAGSYVFTKWIRRKRHA